jgi:hypothetical protein
MAGYSDRAICDDCGKSEGLPFADLCCRRCGGTDKHAVVAREKWAPTWCNPWRKIWLGRDGERVDVPTPPRPEPDRLVRVKTDG